MGQGIVRSGSWLCSLVVVVASVAGCGGNDKPAIAPADAAWKVKKTKKGTRASATWKSAKRSFPKFAVVVDFARRRLTVTVSGADFTAAPTALVRTLVASGADGGRHEATWIERKPGAWRSK